MIHSNQIDKTNQTNYIGRSKSSYNVVGAKTPTEQIPREIFPKQDSIRNINLLSRQEIINKLLNGTITDNELAVHIQKVDNVSIPQHSIQLQDDEEGIKLLKSNPTELSSSMAPGSISGIKFNDLNGNGIKEPNEPGLQNLIITATPSYGETTYVTSTNINGQYKFNNLPSNQYYLVQEKRKSG